jgi:transposase
MRDLAFLPHLEGFAVEPLHVDAERVELRVVPTEAGAPCPLCHCVSARVHSRYERSVADLPWSRARVVLRVQARRFRCLVAECPRRIFCERLPTVAAVYARRTPWLSLLLRAVGIALGGRPAARLVGALHLGTSRMTLLRLVRRAPEPPPGRTPRVLSVDEWSYRRGRRYGIILVDLERRRPIDLLPDASTAALAAWLRAHPGIRVVSRDRSGPFAEATRQAAPAAIQVADRFHLLRNLGRVAERVARRHATLIGRLPAPGTASLPTTLLRPDRQVSRDRTRRALQEQLAAIQALKARGVSIAGAARALGLNWKTAHKYWDVTDAPERRYTGRRASTLAPYETYLQERWRQGERNALGLWREVRQRGYPGAYQNVARYMAALKRLARVGHSRPAPRAGLTVRHAVALALRRPGLRTPAESRALARVKALHPELARVLGLLEEFAGLLRNRPLPNPADHLDRWESGARAAGAPELTAFVAKLEQDRAAVEAALALPYSQGQTEGQITRLKALKRAMFGRANFDLLRKRFLLTA